MKDIYVKDGSLFLMPNSANSAEKIVASIKKLVQKTQAKNVSLNLSEMNMFSALKVAALTSAIGLTQGLDNCFEIIVSDEITKNQISLLSLSNMTISLNREESVEKELVAIKI